MSLSSKHRPEIGNQVEVYKGEKLVVISLLRLGTREAAEAIVFIEGIDDPINDKYFKARIVTNERGKEYVIKHNEKDWTALVFRKGDWEHGEANIPGYGTFPLKYSEVLSRDGAPEHVLTSYLQSTLMH